MKGILRRLRGAIGNALVWSAAWAAGTFGLWSAVILSGWGAVPISHPWEVLAMVTLSAGISGFVTGLAFSGYLRVAHSDGSWLGVRVSRSALVGGLIAVSVPFLASVAWMLMNGTSVPLNILLLNAVSPFVMGGATAGGTVFAAKREVLRLAKAATSELESEQREVLRILGDS